MGLCICVPLALRLLYFQSNQIKFTLFSSITVFHDISKQIQQRARIGKIFARWHLAITHMAVVKDGLPAILPILTEIINSSLLTSVFPSPWKESEIVPILKDGGDPEVANENRPVSLLPALSKICERVALNQFTEYAIRRNCLSGHQSGNKKRHSTETLNIIF